MGAWSHTVHLEYKRSPEPALWPLALNGRRATLIRARRARALALAVTL